MFSSATEQTFRLSRDIAINVQKDVEKGNPKHGTILNPAHIGANGLQSAAKHKWSL